MSDLRKWSLMVFSKYSNEFLAETQGAWLKSVFLCTICCASSLVTTKRNVKWFARSLDELAEDVNTSNRTMSRYVNELKKTGAIETEKKILGTRLRILFRASEQSITKFSFLADEVKLLGDNEEVDSLLDELLPLKVISDEVLNCFS